MKLSKLLAIQAEATRFNQRLEAAINKARENDSYYQSTGQQEGKKTMIPEADRDCTGTKEGAAFKRSATDLKMELSNLNTNK